MYCIYVSLSALCNEIGLEDDCKRFSFYSSLTVSKSKTVSVPGKLTESSVIAIAVAAGIPCFAAVVVIIAVLIYCYKLKNRSIKFYEFPPKLKDYDICVTIKL